MKYVVLFDFQHTLWENCLSDILGKDLGLACRVCGSAGGNQNLIFIHHD